MFGRVVVCFLPAGAGKNRFYEYCRRWPHCLHMQGGALPPAALSYFGRRPPPKILPMPAKPGHIKPVKALVLGQNHPILLQFKLTARLLFQKFHYLLLIF